LKLFFLGALVLTFGGSVAFTQPGGGKGGGFGRTDPDEQFAKYAKGKDVLTVSEVEVEGFMARFMPTEKVRESMNTFLKEKGVSSGQMTRAQYREYTDWSRAKMMEQFQKGGSTPKDGGGSKDGGGGDGDERYREFFKRLDTNSDGFVTTEELQAAGKMGSRLLEGLATYDTNKDGKIDFNEYLEYQKARASQKGGKGGGGGPEPYVGRGIEEDTPAKKVVEEKRVVYRFGKMPEGLPSWYAELDKDKDGQIGLYEWKAAGKDVKEFVAMDGNGDGFVTAEEVLRHQRAAAAKKVDPSQTLAAMVNSPSAPPLTTGSASAASKGDGKGKWGGPPGGGGKKGKWGKQ